jgi:hypothetical protein
MANELSTSTVSFNISTVTQNKINQVAVAKVNEYLPILDEKTRAFDRNNSQTTLSMMSLTMLNGQSPMRMMRQVLAETEKRKMALAEAQYNHAKALKEIEALEGSTDPVDQAEYRMKVVNLEMMESKINGAFKDIATLIDAYNNIKENNNIDDWDEETYEREEKRHHVRRGFELMYRNLLEGGRAQTATIEYLQQYGVHPQVALTEVSGYITYVGEQIKAGILLHSNSLEEFLDQMAEKYYQNADETSKRIFGKEDFINSDYMLRLQSESDTGAES